MARLLAILLFLGSLGCFGIATKDTLWVQTSSVNEGTGEIKPDKPYIHTLTKFDKVGYAVFGVVLLGGSVWSFVLSLRRRQDGHKSA